MSDLDFLLSDEFVEFSTKVKEIHEAKKTKQAAFKNLYDAFKTEIQTLDDQAKGLQEDFEKWKVQKSKGDAPKAEKKI